MKTTNLFQRKFLAIPVLAVTLLMASFDKDDDDTMNNNDKTYSLSGNASGAQENPAVSTSATGALTGTYNAATNRLDYAINWSGLTGPATMVRFYGPASAGANAGVLTDLSVTTNGINGTASGNVAVADSVETQLLAGKVYYNIITATNVNGEIRGQVTAVPN